MELVVEPTVGLERIQCRHPLDQCAERGDVLRGPPLGGERDGRSRDGNAVVHQVGQLLDGQAREVAPGLPRGRLRNRTAHEGTAVAAAPRLQVAGLAKDPQRLAERHRRDREPRRQLGLGGSRSPTSISPSPIASPSRRTACSTSAPAASGEKTTSRASASPSAWPSRWASARCAIPLGSELNLPERSPTGWQSRQRPSPIWSSSSQPTGATSRSRRSGSGSTPRASRTSTTSSSR